MTSTMKQKIPLKRNIYRINILLTDPPTSGLLFMPYLMSLSQSINSQFNVENVKHLLVEGRAWAQKQRDVVANKK